MASTSTLSRSSVQPTFFSPEFTGDGRTFRGLLTRAMRPINQTGYDITNPIEKKLTSTQSGMTVVSIPVAPIMRQAVCSLESVTLSAPDATRACVIDCGPAAHVLVDMMPDSVMIIKDTSESSSVRECVISYRIELTILRGDVWPTTVRGVTELDALSSDSSCTYVWWDTSPMDHADTVIREALSRCGLAPASLDAFQSWCGEYSVYDRLVALAHTWSSPLIADLICRYLDDLPADPDATHLNCVAKQLFYVENYSVPLECYQRIGKHIRAVFTPMIAHALCKQNVSLLMDDTVALLAERHDELASIPHPSTPVAVSPVLTDQQRRVVTASESLVMVQAGAGTGKSTVITQRIAYLRACGVPARDITVLSFTNAAADNIAAKNPDIGSMTIARMLMDIYTLNHPSHRLSTNETIINALSILYPTDSVAIMLCQRLADVDHNKSGAFTRLNVFIENHCDVVIDMLDHIQQTSLELHSIICHQQIDEMVEPDHVKCRHLIIDEVQDNSMFEFIYLLKHVAKYRQSLFIVGDASQTLYEFRWANPRVLNALESSGIFATYPLTTNYRSNQNILSFANATLAELETNQFAHIQLQSHRVSDVTYQSFARDVMLDYHPVSKVSKFAENNLSDLLSSTVIPRFVNSRVEAGEQVAFLAYSRAAVGVMRDTLTAMFPTKSVLSLVSEVAQPSTVLSSYIRSSWNEVLQARPGDAPFVIAQGVRAACATGRRSSRGVTGEQATLALVSSWWTTNMTLINAWVRLTMTHALSHREFFTKLRDNLMEFEIHHNQKKLNVVRQKNEDRQQSADATNADIIVSTIHGVKGLEFPHTVVLYHDTPTMSQEMKRLFYVAFTRAMHSEYILAYGTQKRPFIVDQYELILKSLAVEGGA